jgi:hypothetical protein
MNQIFDRTLTEEGWFDESAYVEGWFDESFAPDSAVPPSFDQDAFRFYEDGTESGSTAIDAESTNITRNVSSDSDLLLRIRIQEEAGAAGSATDDYKLQYEHEDSGTYYDIGSGPASTITLPQSTTYDGSFLSSHTISAFNTSGSSPYLLIAGFNKNPATEVTDMTADATSMTLIDDNINANVVAIEAYGIIPADGSTNIVSSTPSFKEQAMIAVTLNGVDQTTPYNSTTVETSGFGTTATASITGTSGSMIMIIGASQNDRTLTISGSGTTSLQNFSPTSGIGSCIVGYVAATGSSQTLGFTLNSNDNYRLILVEIYQSTSIKVVNFASANLTDGGATTNRLSAGSGSFVAGEISEDGTVDDLQITASNYTELLYSITLKSAELVDTDTLDFRVLRNGAVLNTYTVTPRITVDNGGGTTYNQNVTATLGFVGGLSRSSRITKTAVLSFSGAHVKSGRKVATGTLSFTGAAAKKTNKTATATLSFSGSIARRLNKALTASLSFTGSLLKSLARSLSATLSFVGSFAAITVFIKALTASLSFAGSVVKRTNKTQSAGLSFSGSISRATQKTITATLSTVGGLAKRTSRSVSAALGFTGSLLTGSVFTRVLTAALSFTGAISKRTGKQASGVLSTNGSVQKLTRRSVGASLSLTGAVAKSTRRALSAATSFVGDIAKRTSRAASASLSFAGSLLTGSVFTRAFTASLSFTGSVNKRIAVFLGSSLGFVGAIATAVTAASEKIAKPIVLMARTLTAALRSRSNATPVKKTNDESDTTLRTTSTETLLTEDKGGDVSLR